MENKTTDNEQPTNTEIDPRATASKELLLGLLDSAQGIWKDALDSQIRLTKLTDKLQEEINEINQLTALPNYPAGLQLLQLCIARVQNSKKRLNAVHSRLDALNNILHQREKMQKLAQHPSATTEEPHTEPSPSEEKTEEPKEAAQNPEESAPKQESDNHENETVPPTE